MKKFIIKTILLILPIAVISISIEYYLRAIPNDYSYKAQWLDNNSYKIKIWVFGSSHTYFGINPIYFERCAFNSAHVSQDVKFDHFIFEKNINNMDSLEIVILAISYFTLGSNLEDGIESWRVPNYHIFYGCYDVNFRFWFKLRNESEPFRRAKESLLNKLNDIECSELGWGQVYSFETKSSEWKESGARACKRHTNEKLYSTIQRQNENYILDMCSICKQKNVNVILLTTPTYHTYYDILDTLQLSKTIDFCRKAERMYDNVRYVNLLKDNRFKEDDFFDADHLDEFGAKKLTLILNDTIKKIF